MAPANLDTLGASVKLATTLGVNGSQNWREWRCWAGGEPPVAKKTQFDPNRSVDRNCQFVYKFINRGWLNAVAWEHVVKIQGRETEVRYEVQLVCRSSSVPSSFNRSKPDPECQCAGDRPARRYPSEVHLE